MAYERFDAAPPQPKSRDTASTKIVIAGELDRNSADEAAQLLQPGIERQAFPHDSCAMNHCTLL